MSESPISPCPTDEQPTIKSPHRLAAEGVFEGMALRSGAEERAMAVNWCETAALHLSNEEYWRKRAKAAEQKLGIASSDEEYA